MTANKETLEDDDPDTGGRAASAKPGVALIFTADAPRLDVAYLEGGALVLGRDEEGALPLPDDRVSRQHAEVRFSGGKWTIRDLGSKNGTWVGGRRVDEETTVAGDAVVRLGHSLLLLLCDVTPLDGQAPAAASDEVVAGPRLRAALEAIRRAARAGDSLLITGESGCGKELAARAYHAAGPAPAGPFVGVNCAAIPEGIAESLLFGAKRGAFSGAAADADGYVVSAEGGTLFLDEIGELDPLVQAKLLRVLETKEVTPLGASRGRSVDVRLCAATHRDLRAEVAAGRFREDLYFRIGRPAIALPALRERVEDLPWLCARVLAEVDVTLHPHASLIEACALRPWPGNVRELIKELRRAAHEARTDGERVVGEEYLDGDAGMRIEKRAPAPPAAVARRADEVAPADIEQAIATAGGNLSAAARGLGLHRTQLYRLMKKHGLKTRDDAGGDG